VLTFQQRLMGFVACFSIGMLLSFIATFQLYQGNFTGFASLYTIGNIVALFSTGFLVGAGAPSARCSCRRKTHARHHHHPHPLAPDRPHLAVQEHV
jgi:hypothetical protein